MDRSLTHSIARAAKRSIPFWGRYSLVILLLAGVAYVLDKNRGALQALKGLDTRTVCALFLLQLANFGFAGLAQGSLLAPIGIRLPFRHAYGLALVSGLFNQFLPAQGGAIVRAVFLKQHHGLAYPAFLTLMALNGILSVLSVGILGAFISAAFLARAPDRALWPCLAFFAGIASFGALMLRHPLWLPDRKLAGVDWAVIWERFARSAGSLRVACGHVGMTAAYIARNYLVFRAIGIDVAWMDMSLAGILLLALTAVPLVPGSLGLRELFMAVIMGRLGYGFAPGMVGTLGDRVSQLLVLIPFGSLAYFLLFSDASVGPGKSSEELGDVFRNQCPASAAIPGGNPWPPSNSR